MGKKSKKSEEKEMKSGEVGVCASTTTMPPSAKLTTYGMSLKVPTGRHRGIDTQEWRCVEPDLSAEQHLLDLFKDVVSTPQQLRIIGLLWIESTFPITEHRGCLSRVRDVLHAVFGHETAFFNRSIVEGMLHRGILRFIDGRDMYGREEDETESPFLIRALELSAAFIKHVTEMDKEYAAQTQTEPQQLPSLIEFKVSEPSEEKTPKPKLLTRVESGITLKDHFLEPALAEQIYHATRTDGDSIREMMNRMGIHTGPVKSDSSEKNSQANVILLYGPPGTGKTSAAFAIAGELNVPLYALNVDSIMSPYIGIAERNMRAAFVEYRAVAKSLSVSPVMLMDECDSLMRRRVVGEQSAGDRAMTNVVNVALQEIAAFKGTLVMTTNSIEAIDEAFARRIRTSILLDYPSKDVQAKMWNHYLNISMNGVDTINVDALLAEATLTGALIVKCVEETVERLLIRDGDQAVLTTEELIHTIRRLLSTFDSNLRQRNTTVHQFGFA